MDGANPQALSCKSRRLKIIFFAALFYCFSGLSGLSGAEPAERYAPFQKFLDAKQEDFRLSISAAAEPAALKPGAEFTLHLRAVIAEGWHIYSMYLENHDAPLSTRIRLERGAFSQRGKWKESLPGVLKDDAIQKVVKSHVGGAEFSLTLYAPKNLKAGDYPLKGVLIYRACDNKVCTAPRETGFSAWVRVTGES